MVGTGECERQQGGYEGTFERVVVALARRRVAMVPGAKDLCKCPMDPSDHDDIIWLHTQVCFSSTTRAYQSLVFFAFRKLTSQANGLSNIYDHISYTIRGLQEDNAALQNKIDQLEQGDPSAEVRLLREENSTLRARLASAAKEKSEITWERDALLRKLNGIKLLVDGPEVRPVSLLVYSPMNPHASP